MKRFFATMLFGLVLAAPLAAQPMPGPPDAPDPMNMRRERIQERIESMRIWKLTEALNLDPDRAAVFFPRYRAHLAVVDSLESIVEDASRTIQQGLDDKEKVDYDAQVDRIHKAILAQVDARYRFMQSNKDLLSPKERAAYVLFERRFNQRLRDVMRDIHMQHGAPPMPPDENHRKWRGRDFDD